MHTGLKFTDANGVTRTVSPANPLPVAPGTPALPSGSATAAKQDDILLALAGISSALGGLSSALASILSELEAQSLLLDDIKTNTTPAP